MLIDILNSSNYIMVNRDAIRIFGLNTAVYCAELLNIYKKAVTKEKLYNDVYFKVDRKYIQNQTQISIEEQLKCDTNLAKVNVIKVDETNPDIIYLDVEIFASLLASQDIKLLDKVSEKVKVENPKKAKQVAKERQIIALKECFTCKNADVLFAIRGWIDSICADPSKFLSKQQVLAFKNSLDDYCNGDVAKALEIIKLATVHNYVDCQWAINLYERNNQPIPKMPTPNSPNSVLILNNAARLVESKRTTAVGEDVF